jgi:inhibitor of KinA sporulation pathway (predicted exonuclease)
MAKRLDQILVVDLESTCWEGPPPLGQASEIIEVGVCTVDVASLERVDKRSILIKPVQSEVSEFCTRLTTLTAAHLEEAGSLADATRILKKEFFSQERLWASWGDYDRRQFERVCKEQGIGYPFGISHLNVKTLFAMALGSERELGLDEAYARLGLVMEGTHHRGADDAWNIAGVLCRLLRANRAQAAAVSADLA